MPAGPVPTTAIRSGAKSEGRERAKPGASQARKSGPVRSAASACASAPSPVTEAGAAAASSRSVVVASSS